MSILAYLIPSGWVGYIQVVTKLLHPFEGKTHPTLLYKQIILRSTTMGPHFLITEFPLYEQYESLKYFKCASGDLVIFT